MNQIALNPENVKRLQPATDAKKHTWLPTANTATCAENMDIKQRTSMEKKKAHRMQEGGRSKPISKTGPERRKTKK